MVDVLMTKNSVAETTNNDPSKKYRKLSFPWTKNVILIRHLSTSLFRLYCVFKTKSVSTKALGNRAVCHLTDLNETLSVERVSSRTKKDKVVFVLVFFREEIDQPSVFLGFHQGNRFACMKLSLQWY